MIEARRDDMAYPSRHDRFQRLIKFVICTDEDWRHK